jgi:membrane-bound lytic murein transglycosylase F
VRVIALHWRKFRAHGPLLTALAALALTGCEPNKKAPAPSKNVRIAAEAAQRAAEAAERSKKLAESASEAAGDMRKFRYVESGRFQRSIEARLNPYRRWFEQAAEIINMDWKLLAAIAYQESRWDPLAESENGAMGVMMLTESTAQELGVTDRANPRQSIFAGARYLASMHRKIPKRVPEPDRTWLAVAAYNVGFGHLEDARVLTQMRGKNPDSWEDVREHLPLLELERWYLRVKRGYARGSEPVQFVGRVQRFMVLLDWKTKQAEVLEEVVSVE